MLGVRRKRYTVAAIAVAVAVAAWAIYAILVPQQEGEKREGLMIVVTFPSLLEDIEALLCKGDEVFAIAPSGVDPHDYMLTPQDVEKLKGSDVIISTAHAPFELRIHELVAEGEIGAKLIELPNVAGLRVLMNPTTGLPNYHGLILDPHNYVTFIKNLSTTFSKLRPACSAVYQEKATSVEKEVDRLMSRAPRLNATAVAVSPLVQYAVEWMGIRVKYLLIKEHDLPAVPEDIAAAERALATGEALVVVVVKGDEGTPLRVKAMELAQRYGRPVIYVPSMIEPGSTLSKIAEVINEAERVQQITSSSG